MGADGGVNWARIRGGAEGMARFRTLIAPFYPLHYQDHETVDGDGHWSWLQKNPLPSDCYVSTYGTNQDFHGLESLQDLCGIEEDDPQWSWLVGMTFHDLCLDLWTRPSVERCYRLSDLEHLVLVSFGLGTQTYHRWGSGDETWFLWGTPERDPEKDGGFEPLYAKDHPEVFNMKIIDWIREINDLVDWRTLNSVETWT